MKRTVKAWTVRLDSMMGQLVAPWGAEFRCDIFEEREQAEKATAHYVIPYTIVPCVVTYDDGRKAKRATPRKRQGGGK